MVPLGLQNLSLIGRFLYCVLNSESPLREVPLYSEMFIKAIRERGSVLYLGMATEILNLPYFCITQIMAKEATNPKPSMQRE